MDVEVFIVKQLNLNIKNLGEKKKRRLISDIHIKNKKEIMN